MKRMGATEDGKGFLHNVLFCENDLLLMDALARFIGDGLDSGCATVVIATAARRTTLEERLTQRGVNVDRCKQSGQYVAVDAVETLGRFMTNEWPDEERFEEAVGSLFAPAGGRYAGVRAYGEMVALLCADRKPEAALQVERLWNAFGRKHALSLLCAYPWDVVKRDVSATQLHRICDQHAQVVPQQRAAGLAGAEEPARAVIDAYESVAAEIETPRG